MKIKKIPLLGLFTFLLLLTGCNGVDRFTKKQEQELIEIGQPMIEEFLTSLHADTLEVGPYEMASASQENSLIYAGRYPSNVLWVNFKVDGTSYKAAVDTETKIVYSNYYLFDLNYYIKEQLKPYCDKYGFKNDFNVEHAQVWINLYSHNVKINGKDDKLTNSYVELTNMIPVSFYDDDASKMANAFLDHAPMSDFDITYQIEDDQLFDPRILSDYLLETGNIQRESIPSRSLDTYKITGKKVSSHQGVASYKIELDAFKEDAITYDIITTSYNPMQDLCFTYTSARQYGSMDTYLLDSATYYDFPIVLNDNRIIYAKYDASNQVTLRFENKPEYEISRVCIIDGNKQEEEKLIYMQNDEGMWYLTLEQKPNYYSYSYKFDCEQELIIHHK